MRTKLHERSLVLLKPDAVRTLVHASGSIAEAENEIKIWFKESKIHDYDLAIEKILYSKDWEAK